MKNKIVFMLLTFVMMLGMQKVFSQSLEVGVGYNMNYIEEGHISMSLAYNAPKWGVYVKTYPHENWPSDKHSGDYFTTEKAFIVGGITTFCNVLQLNSGIGKYTLSEHLTNDSWILTSKFIYEMGLSAKLLETRLMIVRMQGNFIQTKELSMYSGIVFGIKLN